MIQQFWLKLIKNTKNYVCLNKKKKKIEETTGFFSIIDLQFELNFTLSYI